MQLFDKVLNDAREVILLPKVSESVTKSVSQ